MKPRNYQRILIALLLLIFTNLACGVPSKIVRGEVTCKHVSFVPSGPDLYSCTCPLDASNMTSVEIDSETLEGYTDQEVKTVACSGYLTNVESTEAQPAEAPTEEPAATEPPTEEPAPLAPFLTGTFTTCDNAARYVNFSIAEGAPAYDPSTFKLLFNGYEAKCAPASNNPAILTCNYPPVSYDPPAGIQVFIGEELVNEFDFNGGSICDPAPIPNKEEPAPTEPPVDGSTD